MVISFHKETLKESILTLNRMTPRRATGEYLLCSAANDPFKAFIPKPLPPQPPLLLDSEAQDLLEKATLALGRLDGVTSLLPDTYLFTYFYVRK
jgi:hypothetical protein